MVFHFQKSCLLFASGFSSRTAGFFKGFFKTNKSLTFIEKIFHLYDILDFELVILSLGYNSFIFKNKIFDLYFKNSFKFNLILTFNEYYNLGMIGNLYNFKMNFYDIINEGFVVHFIDMPYVKAETIELLLNCSNYLISKNVYFNLIIPAFKSNLGHPFYLKKEALNVLEQFVRLDYFVKFFKKSTKILDIDDENVLVDVDRYESKSYSFKKRR